MPHISVFSIPGHSEEEKQRLAQQITELTVQEFHVDRALVSVSVEEIPQSGWQDLMKQIPNDALYVKPPYLEEST